MSHVKRPRHEQPERVVPAVEARPRARVSRGLVFGLLTVPVILAGLWLNLNNFLMGFGGGGVHHGINGLMATDQVALWQTGAWRAYSLDGLLLGRRSTVQEKALSASSVRAGD